MTIWKRWIIFFKYLKKEHYCISENELYECKTLSDGNLHIKYLECESLNSYTYTVNYCPICGAKADTNN